MRLYIKMGNGDVYMPVVKDLDAAKAVTHKISTYDGLVYFEELAMTLDARMVVIACPYSLIDRKRKETQHG